METAITPQFRAIGRTLAEITLPAGTVIATVIRDGQPTVPSPEMRLQPGDNSSSSPTPPPSRRSTPPSSDGRLPGEGHGRVVSGSRRPPPRNGPPVPPADDVRGPLR
ncbi:TrkA C-terminal domain-containing protein [Streptomyces sp. NBC_01750]|uniref:TrkA C-terminal domain-containing protein n=1 Tax=Streptomyces sp. NBC_01750 TaxID=2975928 RepID=UPI002DD93E81|nr:TrkA C-terminal domain-containing protein [Streptomyces sp. NBC_01750]WSD37665.1 hypothetical protein OG966_08670 [Streptomyces sp. NBC_01750]